MAKRPLALTVLFLIIFQAMAGAQVKPQTEGRDADRAAIRAHIESIFHAFINKDGEKLRATHSDNWRGFLEGSRTVIRGINEYMKAVDGGLKNKNAGMNGFNITEFDVIFYGDVAVVNFVADITTRTNNTGKLRILDVYTKENGQWIQSASHTVPHPEILEKRFQQLTSSRPISAEERKRLLEVREQVWRAYFANDRETLEKLIPEDLIAINNDSEQWQDRAGVFAGAKRFAEGGSKVIRLEFPRTEVQAVGNTYIVYTTYLVEIENNGKRNTSSGRGTEIFVSRNGQLVNTGWHLDSGK